MYFGDALFLDDDTVRNDFLNIICVIKCFQSIKKINEYIFNKLQFKDFTKLYHVHIFLITHDFIIIVHSVFT